MLHHQPFIDFAKSTTTGVQHPRTSWNALRQFTFNLPPLPEQRAIARVLSTVQSAIAKQDEIIQTTQALKKTLMHKLFTEGLDDWQTRPLGEIVNVSSGGTPSRDVAEFWDGGTIPWVKTGEITYNLISDTEEKITPSRT